MYSKVESEPNRRSPSLSENSVPLYSTLVVNNLGLKFVS